MKTPIGLRIRNLRSVRGLSQSELARRSGISPSYLNLIEANRRAVGGALLRKIAENLNTELADITGEADQRLIDELTEAFSEPVFESLSIRPDDIHILAARQPVMARAFHLLYRAYLDQRASAHSYANRLRSDPMFADLLHQMLTQITAVRSASEILRDVSDLDSEVRQSFSETIHDQSHDLSIAARSLIAEFEQDAARHRTMSPTREVDDLIIDQRNYFPQLEDAANRLRATLVGEAAALETRFLVHALENDWGVNIAYNVPDDSAGPHENRDHGYDEASRTLWFRAGVAISTQRFQLARRIALFAESDLLNEMLNDPRLTSPRARSLAHAALASYLTGALLFPYQSFRANAVQSHYDLDYLSQLYSASFEQVAHRLVTLRAPDEDAIPFGFVRSNPAGFLSKQFPLPGLVMPNAGHACPLWTVFEAFRAPGTIVSRAVKFADGARFLFIAKAAAKRVSSFSESPQVSSVMLACDLVHADKTVYGSRLSLNNSEYDLPVGLACRLCVRDNCAHRQEPVAQNVALS